MMNMMDFCQAATHATSSLNSSPLRTYAFELVEDLHVRHATIMVLLIFDS